MSHIYEAIFGASITVLTVPLFFATGKKYINRSNWSKRLGVSGSVQVQLQKWVKGQSAGKQEGTVALWSKIMELLFLTDCECWFDTYHSVTSIKIIADIIIAYFLSHRAKREIRPNEKSEILFCTITHYFSRQGNHFPFAFLWSRYLSRDSRLACLTCANKLVETLDLWSVKSSQPIATKNTGDDFNNVIVFSVLVAVFLSMLDNRYTPTVLNMNGVSTGINTEWSRNGCFQCCIEKRRYRYQYCRWTVKENPCAGGKLW